MPNKSTYQYASLALPLSFVGLPLYLYIPDLYATQFGLSLTTIGLLLLAIRFVDAFQDPIIGVMTQNLQQNKTKLSKLFIWSFVALVLSMFLLLHPMQNISTSIWFAASMILCTTAYSVVSIVYQSIGAVWKRDYHARTKITTTREGIGLVGVMLAAVLPTILNQFFEPKIAFQIFFYIFAALILIAGFIWLKWLGSAKFEVQSKEKPSSISAVLKSKSTRPFYTVWFLSQLASAIPVVLVIFFIRDRLELESMTGIFLLVYFLSGVLGMPLWNVIQKKSNKQTAWLLAMALAIISFLWAYFLSSGDAAQYILVCIFSGIALGGELAIPPSILADKISENAAASDSTKFFAISMFIGKFSLALASGFALPALSYFDYSPNTANCENSLNGLGFLYALVPCVIKIIAAIVLSCTKLEKKNENINN